MGRPPRNAGFIRQWRFLLALDATRYGMTLQEAADAAQVTVRTIRRDIDALMICGFPIDATTTDMVTRFVLKREGWRGGEGVIFPARLQ